MKKKNTENVRIIALGGVGEIGKNLYVIEIDSDIFVVDAGLMHPENEMLGIDVVIPDISYLIERAERVKAIFLTHGHDENIGGVFYLLNKLSVPVYGTKLTLALLREKLKQYGHNRKTDLREIHSKSVITFESTKVSFFRTIHSIPDSVGVSFKTSLGSIVCTGDFKFDQTPALNQMCDIGEIAKIGNSGVLALLSDSANAERPGYTPSEAAVSGEISDALYNSDNRVIIAVFASNINRIQQVIHAAAQNGRKIAVAGKNLQSVLQLARKLGYIEADDELFISVQDVKKYPKREVAIVTAGSQGEPLAALTRMANKAHKQLNIEEGDTVVIASTPIPGQELIYSKTVDLLARAGAQVIFAQKRVHVSGHGSQEELKLMINLLKPKYLIPVNGEYRMQKAHSKIAEEIGMKRSDIFLIEKGDVVEFRGQNVKIGDKVPYGNILIDGLGVGDIGNIVLRDRRLLSQDGILIVVITLDKQKKHLVSGPEIITRGFVYVRESEGLIVQATELVRSIVTEATETSNVEWSTLKQAMRDALNQFLYEKTKRKPMIIPIIMEV
ncbi:MULTISPECIES: ribonuclease J2 [unclassified Bacillus (in: firmicutes)]|uniref:ribonuclease J2 n=1 Tax=unclassified Bacillus (in: firmicutes) TaxID=185979 RepID=UPI002280B989|nr:ribonuclease J2 [Bacillus sp. S20C3]MCY8202862.1 ribonuclease J2 [Bacillus sp. N12A5]MCY8287885.1 ribonuclease J2 [Bacillus sp. N13C7]MCY8639994.1 ribonuclease J2 [Bacillus sp. S17B2]MCY8718359.1 ribonuclease J2 [Bacillus sp. S10C12M]MCY9143024.1 ribonuclease J2 [Bacillus sp. T9C1]